MRVASLFVSLGPLLSVVSFASCWLCWCTPLDRPRNYTHWVLRVWLQAGASQGHWGLRTESAQAPFKAPCACHRAGVVWLWMSGCHWRAGVLDLCSREQLVNGPRVWSACPCRPSALRLPLSSVSDVFFPCAPAADNALSPHCCLHCVLFDC